LTGDTDRYKNNPPDDHTGVIHSLEDLKAILSGLYKYVVNDDDDEILVALNQNGRQSEVRTLSRAWLDYLVRDIDDESAEWGG
jgi:hypothetical protein